MADEVEIPTLPMPDLVEQEKTVTKRQPPYNVILLNDDDHTVEYVVSMMQQLFGHPVPRGLQIAEEVHFKGLCIVKTCTLELAELKRDQIHAFGPDKMLPRCKGSMGAEIEPAV